MLGFHQRRRPPRATGLSLGKRLGIEPNQPDGCVRCIDTVQWGVHNKTCLWGGLRSLTNCA